MKKLIIFLGIILLSFTADREFTVKLSYQQWGSYYQTIGTAINAIKNSDIPTRTSLPLIDSLTKLQSEIQIQVSAQMEDTTNKK